MELADASQDTVVLSDDYKRLCNFKLVISEALELMSEHSAETFRVDRTSQLALARLMDVMGAIGTKIRPSTQLKLKLIPWGHITHFKFGLPKFRSDLDAEVLWSDCERLLPGLLPLIEEAIEHVRSEESVSQAPPCEPAVLHPVSYPNNLKPESYKTIFKRSFNKKQIPVDKFAPTMVARLCGSIEPAVQALQTQADVWFQLLPSEHRKTMHGRLRASDNDAHLSAIYELFFYRYFANKGWKVEKDPAAGYLCPDFHVNTGTRQFYLEVVGLSEDQTLKKGRWQFARLLRGLNALDDGYLFSVTLQEWSEEIDRDKILEHVSTWLNSLGAKQGEHYRLQIDEYGFKGHVDACLRDRIQSAHGTVYEWHHPPLSHKTPLRAIRKSVHRKFRRYKFIKDTGEPFVVAMCLNDNLAVDELAILEALYGDVPVTVRQDKRSIQFDKLRPDLFFTSWKNTRASAVICCTRKWDQVRMVYELKVFHNPWAVAPLPLDVFSDYAQLAPVDVGDNTVTLEWSNLERKLFVV